MTLDPSIRAQRLLAELEYEKCRELGLLSKYFETIRLEALREMEGSPVQPSRHELPDMATGVADAILTLCDRIMYRAENGLPVTLEEEHAIVVARRHALAMAKVEEFRDKWP